MSTPRLNIKITKIISCEYKKAPTFVRSLTDGHAMKRYSKVIALLLVSFLVTFHSYAQFPPAADSTASLSGKNATSTTDNHENLDRNANILLLNKTVQITSNDGIDAMYNFKFKIAEYQFKNLRKHYGWHPLPYFLLGLNEWWQLLPYVDNKYHDEAFFAYMDTSLVLAKRIYKEVNKIEGAFFLAATQAFRGRLLGERGKWRKAAFASKSAMNWLEDCRGNEEFSPEILFGDGLFNYYVEWVPENYPMLKPFMLIFPDGDKKKGIEQLRKVTQNAFYTRTEAKYFLMRILSEEENNVFAALEIARDLHETYPDNAYFHRYYAKILYQLGHHKKLEEVCNEIIERIEEGDAGYEGNSGRYASFFLGQVYEARGELKKAEDNYLLAVVFGDDLGLQDKGYYLYSLLNLGQIAEKQKDFKKAYEYYQSLKNHGKKHKTGKIAKTRIKKLKKLI